MLRHFLIGVLFSIASRFFSAIFYSFIFHAELVKFLYVYREMNNPEWLLMPVLEFAVGFVFSVIYNQYKKLTAKPCPVGFALMFALVTRVMGELFNYSMFPYSFVITICGVLSGLFAFAFVGFAIKIFDGKVKVKKSPSKASVSAKKTTAKKTPIKRK